ILMASLASRAADNDPIDLAILAGLKDSNTLKDYHQEKYLPLDPVNKRTEATIKDSSGKIFRVTKGAPQVILALANLSDSDLQKASRTVDSLASHGYRTIGVAVAEGDSPWAFHGILPLLDPPRPDSKSTIARARAYGVKVKMVTGDNVAIARQIASELDMGANIQPATELFPGDVTKGQIPLDAAEKIDQADGIAEARRIFERMTSYVLYRIAMTIAIMVFVVLASIYYHFFPLTAIMLIALALLDDVPIMTIAFDNATVPPQPVRWELDRVLVI